MEKLQLKVLAKVNICINQLSKGAFFNFLGWTRWRTYKNSVSESDWDDVQHLPSRPKTRAQRRDDSQSNQLYT